MPSGRPGGNPELYKYYFQKQYSWDEPCSVNMTLRLPPSMREALRDGGFPGWQEACRQIIAAGLEANAEDSLLRDRGAEG